MARVTASPLAVRLRWRRLPMRTKLLIPVVAGFLLGFIVALWRVPPAINGLVEENLRSVFSRQIGLLRTQVTGFLSDAQADLLNLVNSQELLDYLNSQRSGNKTDQLAAQSALASDFLSKITDGQLPYAELRLLNADGKQAIRATSRFIGGAVSGVLTPANALIAEDANGDMVSVANASPNQAVVLRPTLRQLPQESGSRVEPIVEITVPIYFQTKLAGLIIGGFRMRDAFGSIFGKLSETLSYRCSLADARGPLIAVSSKSAPGGVVFFGDKTPSDESVALPLDQLDGSGTALQTIQSRVYMSQALGMQAGLPDNRWILVLDEDWNMVYASAHEIEGTLILTMVGTLAVVSFGIGLVRQSLIGPLTEVSQVADRIAAGDLQATAPVRSEDEIGMVAHALNTMSSRLADSIRMLEQRVSERTRDLEIAAEVARQATKALELDVLLSEVAERTRSGFDLYQTSVFLHDEGTNSMLLVAAAGQYTVKASETAREVISLKEVSGLLGRAIETKSTALTNDVTMSQDYLPHPRLPDTHAEMVLPMMVGDRLVGTLDVQRKRGNGFSSDDIRVFTSLADQIAIAIRNAQLFVSMQEARRESEALFHMGEAMNAATTYVEIVEAIGKAIDETSVSVSLGVYETYNRQTATYLDTVATYDPDQKKAVATDVRTPIQQLNKRLPNPDFAYAIEDTEASTGITQTEARIYRQFGIRAVLAASVSLGQREIGMLSVTSMQPRHFSGFERRLLGGAAELAAAAIERGRLLKEADSARKAAEDANRIKSQFLANMSHELRTPLNAILNFTAFVADGIMGPVNEEQVEILGQSIASSKHLLSLINDILDVTKIEAGLMDLFIQKVNLNEVLSATVSVAKGLVKDKPIELITDIQEGLPQTYGDKRRLRQVFLNLVSNAVKFTPQGRLTIKAYLADEVIHVAVSDTGIGIAPADQEIIFESFKQAQNDLTDIVGTGLGLPISKFFVESHGGKIWLESAVGVGSTFYVLLPILTEEQALAKNAQIKE